MFKVANLNTATIFIRIISGILTSKAIAVFIGVEGMALIGNLRNFISVVHTVSILGIYNGVVKSVSEFKNNIQKLSETLSTAFYVGFISTVGVALLCYYNAESINSLLFSDIYNYDYIIEIMALALPFYAINMFSFSIMNGYGKYKMLLVINIIGQVLGLLVTLILIYQENIDGALIAAVVAPSLILLVTFVGFINQRSLMKLVRISTINFQILKRFIPFGVVALITAIAIPLVSIFIRNYIINQVGIQQAGYWESMQRISNYYLMFINSIMALYFLPRFSEITNKAEFRQEVFSFYKRVMPIFGLGLILIYFLRHFIVRFIFSESFDATADLFIWQLMGDFVKVASMVIVYQFIAKKMFGHFIIVEIFLVVITFVSSIYLIDAFGVEGAVMGHFLSYLMHFGIILLIFGSSLFGVISEKSEI